MKIAQILLAAVMAAAAALAGATAAAPAPSPAVAAAKSASIPEPRETVPRTRPPLPSRAPLLTILPLGDSITEGVVPGQQDGGYRSRLDALLTAAGAAHAFVGPVVDPQGRPHAGFSGHTIDELTFNARWWVSVWRPQVILLDAGTNDAGRDHNDSATQMLADLRVLLAELRAGAAIDQQPVILLAQPTITVINTSAQRQALQDYGDALPALAAELGGMWVVDMRGVPIAAADGGDGVHPGPVGYAAMATRWLAALRAAGLVA